MTVRSGQGYFGGPVPPFTIVKTFDAGCLDGSGFWEVVPIQSISAFHRCDRKPGRKDARFFGGKFLIAVPERVEFGEVLPVGDSVTGRH